MRSARKAPLVTALCGSAALIGAVVGGGSAQAGVPVAAGGPPSGWVAHTPLHVAPYHSGHAAQAPGGSTVTNPAPQGYIPCDIRDGYYFAGVSGDGRGETIAIVDAYAQPNIKSDLAAFDSAFGVAAPPAFNVIPMSSRVRANQGWGLEESLDVEWAHAIAPAATIDLVEASSNSFSNLLSAVSYAVNTLKAQVVSMSWGGGEFSSEASYDSYFSSTTTLFVASAGDSGAGAMWPSASPRVVSVGGTTLESGSTDSGTSHTACSTALPGATTSNQTTWSSSGGGLSAYEALPAYQSGFNTFSTTSRETPDVAWDANPNTGVAVYDSYGYNSQTGWFQVGGTSVGAPSWAGLAAIADQQRTAGSLGIATGLTASPPYTAYGTSSSSFTDVTSGTNGTCGTDCTAGTGYDLVTGLGTPVADKLLSTSSSTGTLVSP